MMRFVACFTFVVLVLALCGCVEKSPAPLQKETESHYIRQAGFKTLVVFVHGVFGDGETTWTNSASGTYWPELILKDDIFAQADVYVYSYFSPFLSHSSKIDDIIENMRVIFDRDAVFTSHDEVVFLCHSMGGIIVRGYLKRYQRDASKVSLIYFFATPTDGAHIASMAHLLSANPQLGGLMPVDSNDYLLGIQKDWRALPFQIYSRCAFETEDTYKIRIVDERSATSLCDGPVTPLSANHIDIVKPGKISDPSYSIFQLAYKRRPPPASSPLVFEHVTIPKNIQPGQTVTIAVSRQPFSDTRTGAEEKHDITIMIEPKTTVVNAKPGLPFPKKKETQPSSKKKVDQSSFYLEAVCREYHNV